MADDEKKKDPGRGDEAFGETIAGPGAGSGIGESVEAGEDFPPIEEKDFPKVLGGFYRVTRKIGEGGMGVVFEVEHTKMGKKFAAKVISKFYATNEGAVKRFELEAVAASKIESPHIVQVTHLDTEGDFTYIIMELLKGRNLAGLINKRAIPVPLAVEIARQTAKGLIAAHDAGIIHRDLKPENIFLINQEGELYVKLLDFGISKIRYGPDSNVRLTKTGQIIGTPLYFSPEQARGVSEIDGRTDIYALGVILFEMVTGKPVFDAQSPVDLMVKHATVPAPSPVEHNPSVPEELERIILKCLAKEPEERYQTAGELLEDLNGLETGAIGRETVEKATSATDPSVHISDSTKMELSIRKKKPAGSRIILAVAGVVALVAVVITIALFYMNSKAVEDEVKEGEVAGRIETGTPAETPAGSTEETKEPEEVEPEEAAAEAPEEISFSITSTPGQAEVWLNGELAGSTPYIHKVEKDGANYTLEIKAKGYKAEKIEVKADEDFVEHVKLVRIKKPAKMGIKTIQ